MIFYQTYEQWKEHFVQTNERRKRQKDSIFNRSFLYIMSIPKLVKIVQWIITRDIARRAFEQLASRRDSNKAHDRLLAHEREIAQNEMYQTCRERERREKRDMHNRKPKENTVLSYLHFLSARPHTWSICNYKKIQANTKNTKMCSLMDLDAARERTQRHQGGDKDDRHR